MRVGHPALRRGTAASLLLIVLAPFAALTAQAACEAGAAGESLAGEWSGWGGGHANTRYVEGEGALDAGDLDMLELQWAFGFEGSQSVMGQPALAGGRVMIGVDTGAVHSLDAASGCEHWRFQADAGVRTAPVTAEIGGRRLVFVGDMQARVYALDFASGELVWKTGIEEHAAARITGSPQFVRLAGRANPDRLIVPVSSGEEGAAGNPNYPCCSFRGSVAALDAGSGEMLWKTYTIENEPRENAPGEFGPSGAAVWSAPTIDLARGRLYVATGDAYSAPADMASDAVIAMRLEDGAIEWIVQDTAGDIWTVACMRPGAPEECGPDHDFGSPPMLVEVDGRELLVAGQKSGNVWAHEPDSGAVVWRTPMVEDTTRFGGKIIWGGTSDGETAWFGLGPGGIGAVSLDGSGMAWFRDIPPAAEGHPGHDGPLTGSGGLVFSGAWDGVLRALDAANGEVLWHYDTAREFQTVNGVSARGGSMGAAGPVVAGGRLFVPSGYVGVKNGMPGNVLLMFAPQQGR